MMHKILRGVHAPVASGPATAHRNSLEFRVRVSPVPGSGLGSAPVRDGQIELGAHSTRRYTAS